MHLTLMAHTHCMGPEVGTGQGTGLGMMAFYIMLCTVHTTLRLGKEPEPIVSYCTSPSPCVGPGPIPVQCD